MVAGSMVALVAALLANGCWVVSDWFLGCYSVVAWLSVNGCLCYSLVAGLSVNGCWNFCSVVAELLTNGCWVVIQWLLGC